MTWSSPAAPRLPARGRGRRRRGRDGRAGRRRAAGHARPPGDRVRAVRRRRREARLVLPRRLRVRHRSVAAHAARGLSRPVPEDRRPPGGRGRPGAGRPGVPLPVRRRCRARPAQRLTRRGDGRTRRGIRCGGRSRLGRVHGPGRTDLGCDAWAVPRVRPRRRARAAAGVAQDLRPADRRSLALAAQPRPAAAARPAPADDAGPLRDLHRVRPATRTRRPGDRAVRRADVRGLVRPRRPAPARVGPSRPGARARCRRPHLDRGCLDRDRRGQGQRRPPRRRLAAPGRHRRLRCRRTSALRRSRCAPGEPADADPARPGDTVAVRLRPPARSPGSIDPPGSSHRAVPG